MLWQVGLCLFAVPLIDHSLSLPQREIKTHGETRLSPGLLITRSRTLYASHHFTGFEKSNMTLPSAGT